MLMNIQDIPYLQNFPNDGRIAPLMHYFDGERWHYYAPHEGKVIDLLVVDMVSGIYLATAPAQPADLAIPLLTFLFQRKPITKTFGAFDLLYNDLQNSFSSLYKQFVLFRHFASEPHGPYGEVISTELEYAFFNHRSAYDLLNRFVIDFLGQHKILKNEVPDSFRKVVQKAAEDRKSAYGFPDRVNSFYDSRKDQFMILRSVRDALVHDGKRPGSIFKLPEGFAIHGDSVIGKALKKGNLWTLLKPNPQDLGSCLALLAFLAQDISDIIGEVEPALTQSLSDLPAETAPGFQVYGRSVAKLASQRDAIPEYLNNPWRMKFETAVMAEEGAPG